MQSADDFQKELASMAPPGGNLPPGFGGGYGDVPMDTSIMQGDASMGGVFTDSPNPMEGIDFENIPLSYRPFEELILMKEFAEKVGMEEEADLIREKLISRISKSIESQEKLDLVNE